MKVTLKNHTPLWVCSDAVRTCWQSQDKSDTSYVCKCDNCDTWTYEYDVDVDYGNCPECGSSNVVIEKECGEKDKALIDRVGNKFKHQSTLEHLVYHFEIHNISKDVIEMIRNKYFIISEDVDKYLITFNLRALKNFYVDTISSNYKYEKYQFLFYIWNSFPIEHKYLIDSDIGALFNSSIRLTSTHIIYDNSYIVVKDKIASKKDYGIVPLVRHPCKNRDGYIEIKIKDYIGSAFHHRMVIEHFSNSYSDKKPFVNHINGIKDDNALINLEWCTSSENELHSYSILGKKVWNKDKNLPNNYDYKGTIRTVHQCDVNGNIIKTWFNPKIAALEGGFTLARISDCCLGRQKFHKGFTWRYEGSSNES